MISNTGSRRVRWVRHTVVWHIASVVVVALFALDGQSTAKARIEERTAATSPAGGDEIVIRVRRITSSTLTPVGVEDLSREAERLWAAHGVRLEWRDGGEIVSLADAAHLVLLVHRSCEGSGEVPRGALAAFLQTRRRYSQHPPMGRPDAVIMVALDRVQRMVGDAFARQRSVPAREIEAFVPVLVGRVVAHEIGHYLLEDGQHTAHGLMRARYGPDFMKCEPRYSLDAAQRRRLRALWAQRTSAEPLVARR